MSTEETKQDEGQHHSLFSELELTDGAAGDFSRMQHLIDEMDKSNQRIDTFSHEQCGSSGSHQLDFQQFEMLYDDAWKSEDSDAASLQEVPANYLGKDNEDSGCEDAVNSAIAEVSKDFLSGIRATSAPVGQYGESDESHISSDTDFKLITGMASYARYPETAAGLSDNDWNPYGTESDNNMSPHVSSHEGSGSKQVDSHVSSGISFNPPLHSSDFNVNTPSTVMYSIPEPACQSHLSDSEDRTERETVVLLKPDITADFSTISHVSEQTMSPQKSFRDPVKLSDLNKTMRGPQLEADGRQKDVTSSKESLSDQEEKRLIASTSSTGYSSSTSVAKNNEHQWNLREGRSHPASSQYLSVMDRAKLLGIPEDIVDGNAVREPDRHNISHEEKEDDSMDRMSRKYHEANQDQVSDDDYLGQRVQKVLTNTRYLEKRESSKRSHTNAAVDYNMLQRDLQEIQDSLYRTLGPEVWLGTNSQLPHVTERSGKKTPPSSDNDGDIIPSTTTTPDRKKNKMAWDFAADLGYQQPGGLMGDISLDTYTTASRPSEDKKSYNSDGDETRTSGSSDKVEDHTAADQALAEMSEILRPTAGLVNSSRDVDQVLSNFRDQRREIETRYQQLNNQGLAEKVYRILTNQDPESQANGILSEVSADEREMKTQYALGLHQKAFNFSVDAEETNQSLAMPDDVCKRLDLSGLSSNDASRVGDKSSLYVPTSKGFSAFNDMTKFLTSQMAKVSERTFNHSLEMRVPPQVIQCYPVYADSKNGEKKDDGDRKPDSSASARGGATGASQERQIKDQEGESRERTGEFEIESERPASTSSPKELLTEQQNQSNNSAPSPEDSDSSTGRRREKYRPYRPAGSREVYYTESDAASVADSITTIESTHIGSDDARGPTFPSSALGSRRDPPNVAGIYSSHKPSSALQEGEILPPIQERSGVDERDADSNSSHKGDKSSERLRMRDADVLGSQGDSGGAERWRSEGNGDASTTRKGFDARQGREKDEGISIGVQAEYTNRRAEEPPAHNVAAARRNARWANRKEEMEGSTQETQPKSTILDPVDNTRISSFGRQGFQSRRFQMDDFDPDLLRARERTSHDLYSLPTDAFTRTDCETSSLTRAENREPVSVRIRMTYEDDKRPTQRATESYRYSQELFNRNAVDDLGESLPPTSQYHSHVTDRSYRSRTLESEKPYSPQTRDSHSPPRRRHSPGDMAQERPTIPRSYSDENLHSPVCDARLSPAFHRALSPELRHAIEMRSPLLSRDIERSLAQPPAGYPEQHRWAVSRGQDLARSLSPPPTFLARERGQMPRECGHSPSSTTHSPHASSRHSPQPSTRHDTDRIWSPTYRPISMSPTQGKHGLTEQMECSLSPLNRKSKERANSDKLQTSNKKNPSSPARRVELTLEDMTSDSDDTELDKEPVSKRAQLLAQALTQEHEPDVRPDINVLWEQFKAVNESFDSSMNSSRVEAVADLLRNPSRHLITQYLKEREEYRIERQERAEVEREMRLKEQQQLFGSGRQSSSEDDVNGSYAEFLAQKEEERLKRRMTRKKKGKLGDAGKSVLAGEETKVGDNMPDSLFSIPEDASFEQSPAKSSPSKPQKQKVSRHQHVIDPNMNKLRERISKQRSKIDKNTLKELKRVEKLKKLEHLLSAKRKGEISEQTLAQQLEDISSTSTPGSDNSHDGRDKNGSALNTTPLSDDSTTAKDSSAEMHAWKVEKERRIKVMKAAEMEKKKSHRTSKPSKEKHYSGTKPLPPVPVSKKTQDSDSHIRLLRLVKEGYLTPEEAYRLALDKAGNTDSPSPEESLRSSSDDMNGNYSGKLHKLYSPYSRTNSFHTAKARHMPKLKHTPSIYDVAATHPFSRQAYTRQEMWPKQIWSDHNNSQGSSSNIGHGYIRPKPTAAAYSKSRSPSSREKPVISVPCTPGSSRQDSPPPRWESPGSYSGHQSYSPPRRDMKLSPNRQGISYARKTSPSRPYGGVVYRPQSASPLRQEYCTGSRSKQTERQPKRPGASYSGRSTRSENEPPKKGSPKTGGVAWQIAFDTHPSKWKAPGSPVQEKHPLQERKSFSNVQRLKKSAPARDPHMEEDVEPLQAWEPRRESDEGIWHRSQHPQGIPQELWQHVMESDALATKTNHWEVDPLMDKVQYILNKPSGEAGTEEDRLKGREEDWEEKPISKLSLQEAFLLRKQSFISKCRERQKRLALAREDRHMQECLRLEREAIFMDQEKMMEANLHAHPYSDNLHQPKRRIFTKQEMKELTLKRYKTLPEVLQKLESDKRKAETKLNRLRVWVFNKKVQRDVLRKNHMMRRR